MRGTNSSNGKSLEGIDHLKQSIYDILTTPKGSRVMRRDYGCSLFDLTDRPLNQSTLVDIYASVNYAINKFEKRIKLKKIQAVSIKQGKVELELQGTYGIKTVNLTVTI
jgi:hypothetical protein